MTGRGGRTSARVVLILLDGDYEDATYHRARHAEAAVVIAADGGARFALAHGLRIDLLVGDLDSLREADVKAAEAAGAVVERHPVRKDQTDGELALERGLAERSAELVFAGAFGGGLDHVLGHLALLRRAARRGVSARLVSPGLTATAVLAPQAVRLDAPPGTRVSVVPLEGDARVTLEGLAYRLDRGLLPADACLGLGNEVRGAARITVHEGVVGLFVFDGAETFGRPRKVS